MTLDWLDYTYEQAHEGDKPSRRICQDAFNLAISDVLERAAQEADKSDKSKPMDEWDRGYRSACENIAAAIRRLKAEG